MLSTLSVVDIGWLINKLLHYDYRELISEMDSIMTVFLFISKPILYTL